MALHPDFPKSPYAILDPLIRWFPADEALRETSMDKLMPPLVSQLRRKVKERRVRFDSSGAVSTGNSARRNNVRSSSRTLPGFPGGSVFR